MRKLDIGVRSLFMQDKDNGNFIVYVELECSLCGKKDFKSYPPSGITLGDFVNEISKLICPCGKTYKSNPIFGVSPDRRGLQKGNDDQHQTKVKNEQQKELMASQRPPVLEEDIQFLVSLGDSEMGYVARGEVAEMYCIPVNEIDRLILKRINGDNL